MLTFEHANSRYTGTRMLVDMIPAKGKADGRFTFTICAQEKEGRPIPPVGGHYDFSNVESVTASLSAKQISHMLMVLDGRADSILGGKGICDKGDDYTSILHCDHQRPEQRRTNSFVIHIISRLHDSGERKELRILLNPTEAFTLAVSMKSAMGTVAFGVKEG